MKKIGGVCHAPIAVAIALLAGCSAGSSLPSAPTQAGPGHTSTAVRFRITIPKRVPHAGRRPNFISPSTKSMSISIVPKAGGSAVVTKTVDLTPTTGGCANQGGKTVCTLSLPIPPGKFVATLSTFDATGGGGKMLSRGEKLPVTITAGKVNDVSLTLGGVPHFLTVTGATAQIHSAGAGYILYGSDFEPMLITTKDADGNYIVGTGTPYTGAVVSGSGWHIMASPSPIVPNELSVTPPGVNGSIATIKIHVNYDAATCALSGVVCDKTFTIKNDLQLLAVVDCEVSCFNGSGPDHVLVYGPPYTESPVATISNGILNPSAVAADAAGHIFVANCKSSCGLMGADTVTVYNPPYTGAAAATITTGIKYPFRLAANSAGDVFVDNCNTCSGMGSDVVTVYSHLSYTGAPTTISPTGEIDALRVDQADNLLVAICSATCGYGGSDSVNVYAPSYGGMPTTITTDIGFAAGGNPVGLAFDGSNNLLVGNCIMCSGAHSFTVSKYPSSYSGGSNLITTGLSNPLSLAVDSTDNLYVGNGAGGSGNYVNVYNSPSYSGSGTTLLGGDHYEAYEMMMNALDIMFVSDGDTIQMSEAPYSSLTQVAPGALFSVNTPFTIIP